MTKQSLTFAAAFRAYIAALPARARNRSAGRDARFLERHLIDPATVPFSGQPIADVTDEEILEFLLSMRDRPALARRCTEKIRAFFAWAMWPPRRVQFGLRSDPAFYILPRHMADRSAKARYRFLNVGELHAYLAAAATLKPHQEAFAVVLAMTGHPASELGRMRWPELDLSRKVWAAARGMETSSGWPLQTRSSAG
jgi:integrase